MFTYNYHTHTPRCGHADGPDRAYVESAIEHGLKILGFSDHSPQCFPGDYYSGFRMRPDAAENYFSSLLALKEEFKDVIDIKIGFEAEYYPAIFPDLIKFLESYPCDYLIIGQHFLNNEYDQPQNLARGTAEYVRLYVDQVCEAMRTGLYTYLAHPDMPMFVETASEYMKDMERLIACSIETKVPLEVNCLGIAAKRNYPCRPFWKLVGEMGAPVVIGMDAHSPSVFGSTDVFAEAENIIREYNLRFIEPQLRPLHTK